MKKSIFLFFAAILCAIGMNAETYRYSGEKDGWAGTQMTASSDGYYSYYGPVTGAHQFKIGTSSNQWAYNHSYVSKGFNSTDITDLGDYGGDNAYCWSSSQHYILVYHPSTKINSSSNVKICASTFLPDDSNTDLPEPEPEPTELTYNVTVPAGTNVCYICGGMTGWSFTEMTKTDATHYTITIEGAKKSDEYKYSSGADWGYVEKDANGNEIGNRTYVDGNDVVAKWAAVYEPDAVEQELTYSVTVPEGTYTCYIAMDTDPESDGWEFTEMTKVDDTHYTFVRTGLKNKTYKYASGPSWDYVEKTSENDDVADRQWAENDVVANWNAVYNPTPTYTITATANPAEAGTITGLAADGKYEKGATATLTATANDGYEFVNWTIGEEVVSTAAEHSFEVTSDVALVANFKEAEPVYQVIEDEITNFVFDMEAWPVVCQGGPSVNYQIEVYLVLTEAVDGTLSYEDCSVSIMGQDATFIDGTLSNIDPDAPSADAVLHVQLNGEFYELHLAMSAAAAEPIVVVVENATLDDQVESTGFFFMTGECTIDDVIYPVKAEIPGFDKTKAEAEYENVMVEVGTWGGEYVGNATGKATVSIVDNVVTLTGVIENPMTHVAFDVTISGTLPADEPEVISYELNGGKLPAVVVPTNAELWEAFKPYYNTYYGLARADRPINEVSTFANAKMQQIMTDEASEYKWLGDYVLSVATAAGVTLSTDMASANEGGWRWAVHAFFNAAAGQHGAAGINFTEAGKPENWGAAYQAAHAVVLPTEPVAEDYTLPTPVKEGYTFVGWYDNAEGTGEAMTVLPAGWAGTLYAIWKQGTTTALENIAVEGKVVKTIINGQLIIVKDGVQYNAQGAVIK